VHPLATPMVAALSNSDDDDDDDVARLRAGDENDMIV